MKLSKPVTLMLYALGQYYQKANKRVAKGLEATIPKTDFIKLVKEGNLASKQPRAIYKNLEILEKKKLIFYKNRELFITERGFKFIKAIEKEIIPFQTIADTIKKTKVIAITKKPQTIFK